MAEQTTLSFKVDAELRNKVQEVIRTAQMTGNDWVSRALALSEMQSVKEFSPDFSSDLTEVEEHTTRIFEAVSNMIKKSVYLKDSAVRELETKLEQQRELTADLQERLKNTRNEKDQALADLETSQKEQTELVKQMEDQRAVLTESRALVVEYKEKNDTLTGLVARYEGYATENEELKQSLASERSSHQTMINELTRQNNEQASTINDLEQQINRLSEAHEVAVHRINERKDVEQEKALLQAERSHQKAIIDANNTYTEKLKTLYDEMDKQRHSYEQKFKELERQLNNERTKNNKSK